MYVKVVCSRRGLKKSYQPWSCFENRPQYDRDYSAVFSMNLSCFLYNAFRFVEITSLKV